MNLSIDFNTLTMDEAEAIEVFTGLGVDAVGQALQDPKAPKMTAMKAIAAIAYHRENGGTLKAAFAAVGKLPISTLVDGVEVTAEEHPTEEGSP